MPSNSPGRYQSRLFNFINRRTIRGWEQNDRAIRSAQIATIWGVQILLYPLYLLVESAKLVGERVQQVLRGIMGDPKAAQNVLTPGKESGGVGEWESGGKETDLPLADLSGDERVEVKQPISFDLTDAEPPKLSIGIPAVVAEISKGAIAQTIEVIPAEISSENSSKNSSSVGWWQKLSKWVKTTPVAGVVNLFGEENPLQKLEAKRQQLKQRSEELKRRQIQLAIGGQTASASTSEAEEQAGIMASLDRAIAFLETGNFAALFNTSQKIAQQLKQQIINSLPIPRALSAADLEDPQVGYRIRDLIEAGVEYFFSPKQTYQLPPSTTSDDPWLEEIDVFVNPTSPQLRENSPANTSAFLPPAAAPEIASENGIQQLIKRYLKPKAIVLKQTPASNITAQQKTVTQMRVASASNNATNIVTNTDNNSCEWIETDAQDTGYVKHPLEQILDWLDNAMLWLEELIIKVWDWVEARMKK
jgi:hypothetical protein